MTETEHAQWIKQFWKDKLDGMKGVDKYIEQYEVLKIIDKYKAESEPQESEE